jgi:Gpi18-like mannosyltransferase
MEVVLAAATVLLWSTLLLMHERLPAGTSRMIGLGALLCLMATFVVSDRRHTAMRRGASVGRILMLIVLSAVLTYLGYLAVIGWGMQDFVF